MFKTVLSESDSLESTNFKFSTKKSKKLKYFGTWIHTSCGPQVVVRDNKKSQSWELRFIISEFLLTFTQNF